MTRAYRLGSPLVVANLQYFGIVFSALLGYFLFDERLNMNNWAGISLIIISGVMATALRNRAIAPITAEDK